MGETIELGNRDLQLKWGAIFRANQRSPCLLYQATLDDWDIVNPRIFEVM